MGLEQGGEPLGRIDPSSLIGRADPDVVSPRNTALLADAFRQGFITTDEIMERVGERAQLKKKADVMQLQESMSPEAIEARQTQLSLANQKAKMGIELLPDEKDALKSKYQSEATLEQIKSSGLASPAAELQEAGWLPPIPTKGIDNKWQEETIRRWGVLRDFKRQQTEAGQILKSAEKPEMIKTRIGETEGIVPTTIHAGKAISQTQVDQAQQFTQQYAHPALWEQAGRPSLFGKPGEVVTAATTPGGPPKPDVMSAAGQPPGTTAASAAPVVVEAQNQAIAKVYKSAKTPAELAQAAEAEKQINAFRQGSAVVSEPPSAPMIEAPVEEALVVSPAAPVSTAKPDVFPPGFIPTGPAPPLPAGRAFTESQQKALIAEARGLVTQPILDNPGFNPGDTTANLRIKAYNSGTLGELVTTLGPSKAKITEAERNYANASSQWIQGLLRVESGAAISKKEQGWYEKAFFPAIGDPPAVQEQKAKARKAILTALESVITGHQSPEDYLKMREKISQTVSAPGAATSAAPTIPTFGTAEEARQSGATKFWFNKKLYSR